MADHTDTHKALVALKKGTQLIKYGRKGKPKSCPFRLSNDESSLIWISGTEEKSVQLKSVSKIISGQRTLVFQRFPVPEKDHLSFSLIYNDGKRSLDLICKDKAEAQIWFTTLRELISVGLRRAPNSSESPNGRTSFENVRESSLSSNSTISFDSAKTSTSTSTKDRSSEEYTCVDRRYMMDMQVKNTSYSDIRISVSSAFSSLSNGSGGDDAEFFGDLYMWGEVICDSSLDSNADKYFSLLNTKGDVLIPKPLESNVMLDVSYVACGGKHAALFTRQGEVFTWGDGSNGRLGHGVVTDAVHPCLVESLSAYNVEFIACGEYHTCAITANGEMYSWGDGSQTAGLLGHGTNASHWIPKRVAGPLDGLQVCVVSCGTWHTALITAAGQLFTFGDGTFGALGHGSLATVLYPREIASLKGSRTISVSCGVWHTAAVVEVDGRPSSAPCGKLYTWGDGDKYRLGHGDRAPRLTPTCVISLGDYKFQKAVCGHNITIGLTTSGHVFTMGNPNYGQLGSSNADGKVPSLVEDRIGGGNVRDVVCGSCHVAVLTRTGEVYTWGRGANGRLGHGDLDDRYTPTLVESLRDKTVRQIACGSTCTMAICQHKSVSGAEQTQCTACKQAFGFTRKRHTCYNCGLAHCHACSSKRSLGAHLSPNPEKPNRVCDTCYSKLSRVVDSTTKTKAFEVRGTKPGKKMDSTPPLSPTRLQLKDIPFMGGLAMQKSTASSASFSSDRRAASPFSRGAVLGNSSFPDRMEELREANEVLKWEVQKFKSEVDSLKKLCEQQDDEIQDLTTKAREAMDFAAEQELKSKAAKELIRSLTAQVKDLTERLPPEAFEPDTSRTMRGRNNYRFADLESDSTARYDLTSLGRIPQSPSFAPPAQTIAADPRFAANAGNAAAWVDREPRLSNISSAYDAQQRRGRAGEFDPISMNNSVPSKNINSSSKQTPTQTQTQTEWIEQFEPGVYLTLIALPDGSKELKRVRFSRRRFGENQAEGWWSQNRDRVYEKYNIRLDGVSSMMAPY